MALCKQLGTIHVRMKTEVKASTFCPCKVKDFPFKHRKRDRMEEEYLQAEYSGSDFCLEQEEKKRKAVL